MNDSGGGGGGDFLSVFTIYEPGGHLVQWRRTS